MSLQELQIVNSINSLPKEIVSSILQKTNNPQDILNFAATCKQYNDTIKGDQVLWKYMCAKIFPTNLYKVIAQNYSGNWLQELKYYTLFKQEVHAEVIAMSAKHYWKLNEKSLDNINHFFKILTKSNFFYAICILQDIIKKGNELLKKQQCIRPYTLTEIYYSTAVLAHFMHTFLTVKWAKAKLERNLPPELVINFFLQWADPTNLYWDEDVQNKINVLADQVNNILDTDKRLSNRRGVDIIEAVTQVIYKKKCINVTLATSLESLNICKVTDNNLRNVIVLGAVYQAVATRCGACCELIAHTNHFYLEWTDLDSEGHPVYHIELGSGEISPQQHCPCEISHTGPRPKLPYSPDFLLQYIYSAYFSTMAALITWNTQNALQIQSLLDNDIDESEYVRNPYKKYSPYLLENQDKLMKCDNLQLHKLSDEHMELITSLCNLNETDEVPTKSKIAKKHIGTVKFAVGMICYHMKYDYVCVIRGWDATARIIDFSLEDLFFGLKQPFYYITAADQSDRYVAQENLKESTHTTRLYHVEDQISKDFTHFDGFAYVPNEQKKFEYPDDQNIVEVFRSMSQQKSNNL